MVEIESFRTLALSFPESSEAPHFEKTSFRAGKKIFATLDLKNNMACVRLSPIDQDVFSAFDKSIIYPLANKWGRQGWTMVDLKKVRMDLFKDMLTCGFCTVATKRLADLVSKESKT